MKERLTPGERAGIYQAAIRQLEVEQIARIRERHGALARAIAAVRVRRLVGRAAGGMSRPACGSDLVWTPSLW